MVRQKNRYLVLRSTKLNGTPGVENSVLTNALLGIVTKHYGIYGVGRLRKVLKVKYSGPQTGLVILKVPMSVKW